MLKLKVKKQSDNASVPFYATGGAAGFDLAASEEVMLHPGQTKLVSTGLAFEVPEGYELQVRPRSGLTIKTGLRVQIGTVDSDYRGIVHVIVQNTGTDSHRVGVGERIAQGIIAPVIQVDFEVTGDLTDTERGENGFGSTGTMSVKRREIVDLHQIVQEVMK